MCTERTVTTAAAAGGFAAARALPVAARLAVALVWLYHGVACKLLGPRPSHLAVVGALPGVTPAAAGVLLVALGLLEVALAFWVLAGWRPRAAALTQTAALGLMNAGGLVFARAAIADPGAMVVGNLAFLTLIWVVATGGAGGAGR